MFYSGDLFLKLMAVIPSVIIIIYVYKKDRLEKEPVSLLIRLFVCGALSIIPTVILEELGIYILSSSLQEGTVGYSIALNFIVIGISEELCKYFAMKISSWDNPQFNCSFDGVVYGVTAALGFATVENLLYVLPNGAGTALVRGLVSVPAHASFGVFMGAFYGASRKWFNAGKTGYSRFLRIMGLVIPILFHGLFDFCLTEGTDTMIIIYFIFVPVMFIATIIVINKLSKCDEPIAAQEFNLNI